MKNIPCREIDVILAKNLSPVVCKSILANITNALKGIDKHRNLKAVLPISTTIWLSALNIDIISSANIPHDTAPVIRMAVHTLIENM